MILYKEIEENVQRNKFKWLFENFCVVQIYVLKNE